MIKDKYKTFLKSLLYSYQSADVRKVGEEEIHKALINPDKIKQNYDDKILSIDYQYNFQAGDIFEWVGTHTYWIVYLQQLTEDAYFRSEIRECKYQLSWIDWDKYKDGKKFTSWAYIRGPVETKVNFIQKSGISVDVPNLSLEIYLPNNEDNLRHFKRYQRFMFNDTVWEVQTVDSISTKGIIQIVALEYFMNQVTDSQEEQVTDAFYIKPIRDIHYGDDQIHGENFIKPLMESTYFVDTMNPGEWSIEGNRPVQLESRGPEVIIKWTKMTSGQFVLVYKEGDTIYRKTIVVESLF